VTICPIVSLIPETLMSCEIPTMPSASSSEGRVPGRRLCYSRPYSRSESWVEPDQLSLRYLSGCRLIPLESIGVNLDLFYRLLWKHIFVVELIKLKYPITNESDSRDFLAKILDPSSLIPARRGPRLSNRMGRSLLGDDRNKST
jgi:hypothetical protein